MKVRRSVGSVGKEGRHAEDLGRQQLPQALAEVCLIAAPLVLGVSDLIRIWVEGGAQGIRDQLDLIAASPGAWQVATILNMLGIILFVPAAMGLLHLLCDRGVVLGHIGGALLLIGLVGLAAHNSGYYGTLAAASDPGIDKEQMVRFILITETIPGNLLWVIVFLTGNVFGTFFLGLGLFWARIVPRWTSVLIVLSVVVSFLAQDGLLVPLISSLLGLGGFGTIGLMLLRESDTEWAKHAGLSA
jgi:hypothetical protein